MSSYEWPPQGSGSGGGGVTSLNTLTGALVLVAGSGITITPSGSDLIIAGPDLSGYVPYVGATADVDLGANSLTIGGASEVIIDPSGYFTISADSSALTANNFAYLTGVFPTVAPSANVHGLELNYYTGTSRGVDSIEIANYVQLQASDAATTVGGYYSASFDTTTFSAGNDLVQGFGNFGASALAQGGGTGLGAGFFGFCTGYAVSVGVIGQSQFRDIAGTQNIGVMGYAGNDGAGSTNIGGHFFLKNTNGSSLPYTPPAVTTALLVDNSGYATSNIADFYSAGSPALFIDPSGFVMGAVDGVLQIGAYNGSAYDNRFKSIYVTNHIGRDGNSYFDFNTFASTSGILVVAGGQGSWAFVNPYSGNFDFQSQQGSGDYANITWSTDGTSGDIGATNNGAVLQRPRNIYAKGSVQAATVVQSTDIVIPTNGGSSTADAVNYFLQVALGGTIASYTVTMPAAPIDGQIQKIMVQGTITALTVSPNSGQNIIAGSVTAFTTGAQWTYSSGSGIWFRNY